MSTATIVGREIHVNDEGFMTDHTEWTEDVARALAANIGIELTDAHWQVLRFVRQDYDAEGESPPTSAACRPSSCSPCSPRSPPRRCPTSPGSPSPSAVSEEAP